MHILKPFFRTEDSSPYLVKACHFRGIRWPPSTYELESGRVWVVLFSVESHCCFLGTHSGDSYSSSPDSTPMGSIESLSSHSSEQNSTTKSASCQPREKSGGIPWIVSPSPSNGQKSLGIWATSPESSSKEDATKTDAESDCQSVASITSPGDVYPPIDLVRKGPYGLSGLKRASASSLRSISAAEGKAVLSSSKMPLSLYHLLDYSAWLSREKLMVKGLTMLFLSWDFWNCALWLFSSIFPSLWGDVFVITVHSDLPAWWAAVLKEHSVPSQLGLEKNASSCYAHVLCYCYYFVW